jgi:hypothetical protein
MVDNKCTVIVLGCKDKELTEKRVRFAEAKLKNSNKFKVIFSGTKEEVKWMKEHSNLKAIPEDKSRTTPENLINSKKLIGDAKKIWIITDKSHAFRTRFLARKVFTGKTIRIVGVKVPITYIIKQTYYEWSRLIRHVFELG